MLFIGKKEITVSFCFIVGPSIERSKSTTRWRFRLKNIISVFYLRATSEVNLHV